jgi:hypothetical protein
VREREGGRGGRRSFRGKLKKWNSWGKLERWNLWGKLETWNLWGKLER